MLQGATKLSVVGARGRWLLLSDPATYRQYLCRELALDSPVTEALYRSLV